jgi:hypothetical protein
MRSLPSNGYLLLLRIRFRGMCLLSRCLGMGPYFTVYFDIRVPIFMRTSPMSVSNTWGVSVFIESIDIVYYYTADLIF